MTQIYSVYSGQVFFNDSLSGLSGIFTNNDQLRSVGAIMDGLTKNLIRYKIENQYWYVLC